MLVSLLLLHAWRTGPNVAAAAAAPDPSPVTDVFLGRQKPAARGGPAAGEWVPDRGRSGRGITTSPPPDKTLPPHVPWINGTWTTGYWDCCKPSCAWEGKGNVDRPVASCSAETWERLADTNEFSICSNKTNGTAASCLDNQPFIVRRRLALGFAAAAVGGKHGLTGDDNCGQCYELKFVDRMHTVNGTWGGAHRDLVNKSMIVQVTNIGYDVSGNHSFDIQLPGAGQGLFTGCQKQFKGWRTDDFDCGTRYGGCDSRAGCVDMPPPLQPGCYFRFDWYRWLMEDGQTNNPWVDFRRVRCPKELTKISLSTPLDDHLFRGVDFNEYN